MELHFLNALTSYNYQSNIAEISICHMHEIVKSNPISRHTQNDRFIPYYKPRYTSEIDTNVGFLENALN